MEEEVCAIKLLEKNYTENNYLLKRFIHAQLCNLPQI